MYFFDDILKRLEKQTRFYKFLHIHFGAQTKQRKIDYLKHKIISFSDVVAPEGAGFFCLT